jgi:uncharacterized protein YebE (UPF0316 family)
MVDVTLGTMRHIFIAKGFRKIVPFLGFIEVLIWLLAISQIMKNLNNIACYFGWAMGFSLGTYFGMLIESKLALGLQVIRIITPIIPQNLARAFFDASLGVTVINGQGAKGPVNIFFTIIKRKDVGKVLKLIEEHAPNAFYSIEDIRTTSQGVFPQQQSGMPDKSFYYFRKIFPVRKGK